MCVYEAVRNRQPLGKITIKARGVCSELTRPSNINLSGDFLGQLNFSTFTDLEAVVPGGRRRAKNVNPILPPG